MYNTNLLRVGTEVCVSFSVNTGNYFFLKKKNILDSCVKFVFASMMVSCIFVVFLNGESFI